LRDRFLAGAEPRRRVRQINRRRMGSVVLAIYVGAAWDTGSVRCIEEFGLGVDTFPVVVGKPPGVARSCGSDLIAVQADVRFDRSDELVPRISTVPGLAECHHPSLPRRKRGVRFLQEVGDVWKFGWIGTRWIEVGIGEWALGAFFSEGGSADRRGLPRESAFNRLARWVIGAAAGAEDRNQNQWWNGSP